MQLTQDQKDQVGRAAAILAEEPPSLYELPDMAGRIGRLEWHLGEMLRLIAAVSDFRQSQGAALPRPGSPAGAVSDFRQHAAGTGAGW